jgi:DNA-binding PadR family transcriptional regulator
MFRDHSLAPAEALRLAALGMLAEAPRRYGDLAAEIRHFATRIVGPTLELMGTSLEVLRYEGLVEAVNGRGMEDNAMLQITASGRAALFELLRAGLRTPLNQFNKLFLAIKLRFLHLLAPAEQVQQLRLVAEWYRSELERLEELRHHHAESSRLFLGWLEQETAQIRTRLGWLLATAAEIADKEAGAQAEQGPKRESGPQGE